jgi:hypothetical protein
MSQKLHVRAEQMFLYLVVRLAAVSSKRSQDYAYFQSSEEPPGSAYQDATGTRAADRPESKNPDLVVIGAVHSSYLEKEGN